MKYIIPVSLLLLFIFTFCEEHFERTNNYDENSDFYVSVNTIGLIDSSASFATLYGSVDYLGPAANITEYGFCWSDTTNEPTIESERIPLGSTHDTLTFSYRISDLQNNAFHHYRSYAINTNDVVFYGNIKAFKTLEPTAIIKVDSVINIGFYDARVCVSVEYPENLNYQIGIAWSESNNVGENDIKVQVVSSQVVDNKIMIDIDDLGANVQHYLRAFILDEEEDYLFSNICSFLTKSHWKEISIPVTNNELIAVASINNKAYLHFRDDYSLVTDSCFLELNLDNYTLIKKSTPDELMYGPAFAYNNKCYFATDDLSRLVEYNINTDSWSDRATFPANPRGTGVAFHIGDKFYFGGGESWANDAIVYHADFYCYDITGNSWSQKQDLPYPEGVSFITHYTLNGIGYIIRASETIADSFDTYAYNPTSNNWELNNTLPELPNNYRGSDYYFGNYVQIGNKAYWRGGDYGNLFIEYNITSETWTNSPDDKYPDYKIFVFSSENKAFAYSSDTRQLYEYISE